MYRKRNRAIRRHREWSSDESSDEEDSDDSEEKESLESFSEEDNEDLWDETLLAVPRKVLPRKKVEAIPNQLVETLISGASAEEVDQYDDLALSRKVDAQGRTALHLALLADNLTMVKAVLTRLVKDKIRRERRKKESELRLEHMERGRLQLYTVKAVEEEFLQSKRNRMEEDLALEQEQLFIRHISRPDKDGWTAIHYAAQACFGCMSCVLSFAPDFRGKSIKPKLARDIEKTRQEALSSQNATGCTPLHIAASNGNMHAVSELIRGGAKRHVENIDRETPMDVAKDRVVRASLARGLVCQVSKGDENAMKSFETRAILGEGLVEPEGIRFKTSIHEACERGCVELVSYLVESLSSEELCSTDACGWGAIHYCAQGGTKDQRHIAELLMIKGANANQQTISGLTPLHLAATSKNCQSTIELLLRNGAKTEIKDKHGLTPFLSAARKGCVEAVRALESAGCDILATENRDWNALHLACFHNHQSVVEVLSYLDAERNLLKIKRNMGGKLPTDLLNYSSFKHKPLETIWGAAQLANLDAVRKLIRQPQSLCTSGKTHRCGFTVLHCAVLGPFVPLLSNRSRKSFFSALRRHFSASDIALQTNRVSVLKYLLQLRTANFSVDSCDNFGCSALHYACMLGDISSIDLLIKSNASLHCADSNGNTALHYAHAFLSAHRLQQSVINAFDQDALNHLDQTPLQVSGLMENFSMPTLTKERKISPDLPTLSNQSNTKKLTLEQIAEMERPDGEDAQREKIRDRLVQIANEVE